MFGTIRRHQTWLWIIIATLTIASFVIFGPTNAKIGNALSGKEGDFGSLGGRPITREQLLNARKEAELRYLISNGDWPDSAKAKASGFNLDREMYLRLLIIQKQKDLGIQVSTAAAANYARQVLGPETATFDNFVDRALKPHGIDVNDFERFLQHEVGLRQLFALAGLNGSLVIPQEAEAIYRREHQDLSASIVFFPASNFLASVAMPPGAVSQFYTNHMANYRIPDRRQVDYVKYDVTNYMAEVKAALTNLDERVEANYQEAYKKYGTNLFSKGESPAEIKAMIKEQTLLGSALQKARKAAGEFAEELDAIEPKRPGNLEALAKKKGLTVRTTAPFDREDGPQELKVDPTFAQAAFSLTDEEPFRGPLKGEDGVYVIALKQQLPSEIPAFASIESKVTADYRLSQAQQLARQAGTTFANTVTNSLAQGKSFDAISNGAKVKAETLPRFSLSTRGLPELEDRLNFNILRQVAFSTPPGKASPFIPTREGGFVLYVKEQLPVDEAKLQSELPRFISYMREMREQDAFNQWFSKQVQNDPAFAQLIQRSTEGSQMKQAGAPRPKS